MKANKVRILSDDNYEVLPNEDEFWDLVDSESSNYDENYLLESNWDVAKLWKMYGWYIIKTRNFYRIFRCSNIMKV